MREFMLADPRDSPDISASVGSAAGAPLAFASLALVCRLLNRPPPASVVAGG